MSPLVSWIVIGLLALGFYCLLRALCTTARRADDDMEKMADAMLRKHDAPPPKRNEIDDDSALVAAALADVERRERHLH